MLFHAAVPCLREFEAARLELSNDRSYLARGFSSDIEQLSEFTVGGPAQVSEIAVASAGQ